MGKDTVLGATFIILLSLLVAATSLRGTSEYFPADSTMQGRNQFSEYTESEFLDLLADIVEANGSEEYQDQLLEHFIQLTEHPLGSDLIYYPENPADATPERILESVKEWRARNGLPSFKG